jgi:hypothetical protein
MPTTRSLAFAAFLLSLAAACAPAPPAERPSPATLPPLEPGLAHYAATLTLDPVGGALAARYRTTWIVAEGRADTVPFVLNSGLTLDSIRGPAYAGHRAEPSPAWEGWTHLLVALRGVEPGDTVALEFHYGGAPEVPGRRLAADGVELNLDAMWHPVSATFDQSIVGELRLALPEGWTLVSGGEPRREAGDVVVRSTIPLPDVAFLAAPGLSRLASERYEVYHRDAPEAARRVLDAAAWCGDFLDGEFGRTRPLPSGRVVIAGREEGGGYARVNYIVLNEVPAQERSLVHYLCHELAHFWTDVGDFMSPDHWMSEAFAEYAAARAVRARYGEEAFVEMIERWEGLGRTHGPVWTAEAPRRPNEMVMYRRAPALLYRLEERVGREVFDRFFQRYMIEEVRTTRQLLDHLREVAGPEATEWFIAELGRSPEPSPSP